MAVGDLAALRAAYPRLFESAIATAGASGRSAAVPPWFQPEAAWSVAAQFRRLLCTSDGAPPARFAEILREVTSVQSSSRKRPHSPVADVPARESVKQRRDGSDSPNGYLLQTGAPRVLTEQVSILEVAGSNAKDASQAPTPSSRSPVENTIVESSALLASYPASPVSSATTASVPAATAAEKAVDRPVETGIGEAAACPTDSTGETTTAADTSMTVAQTCNDPRSPRTPDETPPLNEPADNNEPAQSPKLYPICNEPTPRHALRGFAAIKRAMDVYDCSDSDDDDGAITAVLERDANFVGAYLRERADAAADSTEALWRR